MPLSSLPPPEFSLRSNNREETQPCPSTENWIRFKKCGPAHQYKTQFPPQSSSIRKLPKASNPYPSEGRPMKTTITKRKKVKVKSLSHVFATPWTVCSLPGSSIHGIFQARVLEWVSISFSRGSSQPRDQTWVSRIAGRHVTI